MNQIVKRSSYNWSEMKKSVFANFVIIFFVVLLGYGCQSVDEISPESEIACESMYKIQKELNIDQILKQDRVIFEGIEVYRVEDIRNNVKSVLFAMESGVQHGPARMYLNGKIIADTIYLNGIMSWYYYIKIFERVFCLSINNGKPDNGNLLLPGHSNYGVIGFKNGKLTQVSEYKEDGSLKVIFDISDQEFRDGKPWNGHFISDNKNIDLYFAGEIINTKNESEVLSYIREILDEMRKSKSRISDFNIKKI